MDVGLISDVLAELQSGIEAFESSFIGSSLYEKEMLVDSIIDLLDIALIFETIFLDGDDIISKEIQALIRYAVAEHEAELRREGRRRRGRPCIDVYEDQLQLLVGNGFKVTEIARMFDCSRRTIQRRIIDFGFERNRFSTISDTQLDQLVGEIVAVRLRCGIRSTQSTLRAIGVQVQRERVRASLHRVDPVGVDLRLRRHLHRRTYSVPFPNYLWHIDGYHKLIRWRFVIHGGVDGYSRVPVYLTVSPNNRSDSVLNSFLGAVSQYGVPLRVRADHGGENVRVEQFMCEHPHRGPECFIYGRSVHNQRIERLWRDLFEGCVSFFYFLFYSLEEVGILNPDNEIDLAALHHVYLPIIQQHLTLFSASWCNHPLRTERHYTPNQLWVLGMLSAREEDPTNPIVQEVVGTNQEASCNVHIYV